MLDESLVFHKTASGAAEVGSPSRGLPPKLRRALILVDGAKSVAELAPAFRPGEIDAILEDLQARGLVSLAGGASAQVLAAEAAEGTEAPSAGGAPGAAAGDFEAVRRRAMSEISHRLGPNGDALALRVERCRTPEELRVALREAEKILSSFLGADYGRSFAQKIGRDLV